LPVTGAACVLVVFATVRGYAPSLTSESPWASLTRWLRVALLGTIRALRAPVFDIDDQFATLSPWPIYAYSICVAVSAGNAIYLATMANRIGIGFRRCRKRLRSRSAAKTSPSAA
jgi:hypothetical protein